MLIYANIIIKVYIYNKLVISCHTIYDVATFLSGIHYQVPHRTTITTLYVYIYILYTCIHIHRHVHMCIYIYICVYECLCVCLSPLLSQSPSQRQKRAVSESESKAKALKCFTDFWNHAEKQAIFQGQVSICIGCSLLCF